MPGVSSEHLTAARIYGIGKGAFQEGVQGMFRISNGVPFSPVGHPEMLGVKNIHAVCKQSLAAHGLPLRMAAWCSQSYSGSRGAPHSSEVLRVMT